MKNYRRKDLSLYLLALYMMIFLFSFQSTILSSTELIKEIPKLLFSAGFLSVAYLLVFIFESLISSEAKSGLIFFGNKHMSGNVVIDKLLTKRWTDVRIKYQDFNCYLIQHNIEDHDNAQWYKIYYGVKENGMVKGAQKDYLMARDLCVLTGEVLVSYLLGCMVISTLEIKGIVVLILVVLIISNGWITRVLGKRFVINAIVAALNKEE